MCPEVRTIPENEMGPSTMARSVDALRYKPEGRGFDSRCHSGRTMALESTHRVTELCTKGISWWVKAVGA